MNRLYAIEATPSVTGSMADHRIALRPSEIPNFAAAIAAKIGLAVQSTPDPQRSPWISKPRSATCKSIAARVSL